MENAYKNLGYFFLLLLPLVFLGFYKTYFGPFTNFGENITVYVHLHAFIATIWVLLLIVQPLLIAKKKLKIHRFLGKVSYVVFPLLILSFAPQIDRLISSDTPQFVFFPFADSVLLVMFYVLAIFNKRILYRHMRYMIGTATVFLGPALGRIGPHFFDWSAVVTQNVQYGIIFAILIGLILFDMKNMKKYRPYLFILAAWTVHMIVFNTIF